MAGLHLDSDIGFFFFFPLLILLLHAPLHPPPPPHASGNGKCLKRNLPCKTKFSLGDDPTGDHRCYCFCEGGGTYHPPMGNKGTEAQKRDSVIVMQLKGGRAAVSMPKVFLRLCCLLGATLCDAGPQFLHWSRLSLGFLPAHRSSKPLACAPSQLPAGT